jgi:hypothetical protein
MSDIKKGFTKEQIIQILTSLGSESYHISPNDELIFQTVCHNASNGSYKLYYYPDSGYFHCYTNCGKNFSIYDLVKKNKHYSFIEARVYINNLLNIKEQRIGFISDYTLTDDWDIFNKYSPRAKKHNDNEYKHYPKTLLQFYKHLYPVEWLAEGILPKSLERYHIRYDLINNKIIIPHYDIKGHLIGIRGRALNKEDEVNGKYRPVIIENEVMRHSLSNNLYGLNINKKAIKTIKKIMIFEAEKSVIKCGGFYGRGNFTVACCGSNISITQRNIILSLGVNEVFIAFDKEYHQAYSSESDDYSEKIHKLAYLFTPYVTTYVLWDCKDNLLDYKDSPCDKGQEVFEKLMKNKIEIVTQGDEREWIKV